MKRVSRIRVESVWGADRILFITASLLDWPKAIRFSLGNDRLPQARVGGEDAMVRHEIPAGRGDQRGRLFYESKGFENNGPSPVPKKLAQPVVHPPIREPAEPGRGNGPPCDVST